MYKNYFVFCISKKKNVSESYGNGLAAEFYGYCNSCILYKNTNYKTSKVARIKLNRKNGLQFQPNKACIKLYVMKSCKMKSLKDFTGTHQKANTFLNVVKSVPIKRIVTCICIKEYLDK